MSAQGRLAITPDEFRTSVALLIGEGAAADVAEGYRTTASLPGRPIDAERSGQKLLGLELRSTCQRLTDLGLDSAPIPTRAPLPTVVWVVSSTATDWSCARHSAWRTIAMP